MAGPSPLNKSGLSFASFLQSAEPAAWFFNWLSLGMAAYALEDRGLRVIKEDSAVIMTAAKGASTNSLRFIFTSL
jgi:hypothetical protein